MFIVVNPSLVKWFFSGSLAGPGASWRLFSAFRTAAAKQGSSEREDKAGHSLIACSTLQNQPQFLQDSGQTYVHLLDFRHAKGFTYGNSIGNRCPWKKKILAALRKRKLDGPPRSRRKREWSEA
jgi:hypothetical protein